MQPTFIIAVLALMLLPAPPAENWTADKVRELRTRLGWTQAKLADALGYEHRRSVSEIEGDRRKPSGSARVLLELIDSHDGLPSKS